MEFKKFNYNSLEELKKDIEGFGLDLPLSEDLEILALPVGVNNKKIPNSMAYHPMEGCDGELDGRPGELNIRRYERFAAGGAGLLWFEAVAVVREGRAYPRQLWINKENVMNFKDLNDKIIQIAADKYGSDFKPLRIMQLTHSGRFSKPEGKKAAIIACENPYIDKKYDLAGNYRIISDEELQALEDKFLEAAILAAEAGFDGVDIKSCHRYLISELYSAFTREGRYGGSFENRTSFILNIMDKIKAKLGKEFIITTRMNIYDGIPYPYGFGVEREDYTKPNPAEPLKLVEQFYKRGVRILNISMGSPYYNPHVNRPFDSGEYLPGEHPLEGIARMTKGISTIQKSFPDIAIVGTGYSWLRHLSPYLAAGNKKAGNITLVGYGRESFAYPDFANDILNNKKMEKNKCCIACGKCTEIMRAGGRAGCVIRDAEIYAPLYKECMNS